MKITIFGATGMVGKVLTAQALNAGHEVTALVRSPEKLGELADKITSITGDYLNPADQQKALDGAEAVLSTIGPSMQTRQSQGEYEAAMRALVDNMQQASVKRIVAIAGAGVKLGDEKVSFKRALMRRALITMGGAAYRDKEAEHNVLCKSALDWTIVRPPQVTDTAGDFQKSDEGVASMKVDTAQLTAFMLDTLSDEASIRTAPFVSTV